jgi:hypothetical protein
MGYEYWEGIDISRERIEITREIAPRIEYRILLWIPLEVSLERG